MNKLLMMALFLCVAAANCAANNNSWTIYDKKNLAIRIEWREQTNSDHQLFDSLKPLYVAAFEKPEQEFYNTISKESDINNESTASYLNATWKWEPLKNSNSCICACCRDNNQAIGFAVFIVNQKTPNRTMLAWIAIHPDHQNRGLSKHLLASVFTAYPDVNQIVLYTYKTNTTAQTAYLHFGFKPINPDDYGLEGNEYISYFLYTRPQTNSN